MLKLSYEQILEKVQSSTGKSKFEIESLIENKQKQLSDLISKEGAAHIIANELSVKLFENLQKRYNIKDLISGMNSIEVLVKVSQIYGIRAYSKNGREGRVANILVGDGTGACRAVLWDNNLILKLEKKEISENQTILIKNAYIRENNGFKEIHLGARAEVEKSDETVEFNDQRQIETKKISSLNENDFTSIEGTVVQVFEPRFYNACPECRKKVNEESKCETHGSIVPKEIPIVNIYLDDGTENIRLVLFNENANKLVSSIETLKNPDDFRDEVLGKQIKATGKVVKNDMFDRNEFMVNSLEELKPEEMVSK
jgi:replication factor A1